MKVFQYKPIVACLLGVFAGLVVSGHWFFSPHMLDRWEWTTYDWRLKLHPATTASENLVMVGRDMESVTRFGVGVWDRTMFAEVFKAFGKAGAAVVAPDFYFVGQSPPGRGGEASDTALREATAANGRIVFPLPTLSREPNDAVTIVQLDQSLRERVLKLSPPGSASISTFRPANIVTGLLPELTTHAAALGHIWAVPDLDGGFRRVPLYVDVQGALFPSFGLAVAATFLDVPPKRITIQPGRNVTLHRARFPNGEIEDVVIPIDLSGNMLINYASDWEHSPFPYFSFVDVWDAVMDGQSDDLKRVVNGNIVVVLPVALEGDKRQTPFELKTPGGFIHTNIINTILMQLWLKETPHVVWALLTFALSALAAWFVLWRPGWKGTVCVKASGITYLGVAHASFVFAGVVLPILPPLYGAIVATGVAMGLNTRFVRGVFGQFLGVGVVDELLDKKHGLDLGGEMGTVTVLMSDLRGFTAMSERLEPKDVVTVLNQYLDVMIETIDRYGGTLNEFMGDGLFVMFGAPQLKEDDAERAVACAMDMQLSMDAVNRQNRQRNLPDLEMGIGLNTGDVVIGNLGSTKRMKWGVIGKHVNLAARIQSYTVGGQVLISESTRDAVGCDLIIESRMEIRAKGIDYPVPIYDVRGITGNYGLMLPEEERGLVRLDQPVSLRFAVVEGSQREDTWANGQCVQLSLKWGQIESDELPPPLTNIKLKLIRATGEAVPGDAYAKVMEIVTPDGKRGSGFVVRFSPLPPDVEVLVRERVSSILF